MSWNMVEEAKHEFTRFLRDIVTNHKEEFLGFSMDVNEHCLNAFYFKYLEGRSSFLNFTETSKIFLTFSHGQASVEHGNNVNRSWLIKNLKKWSIVLQRIVYDHMIVNGLKAHEIIISSALLVPSSRQDNSILFFCEDQKRQGVRKIKKAEADQRKGYWAEEKEKSACWYYQWTSQ